MHITAFLFFLLKYGKERLDDAIANTDTDDLKKTTEYKQYDAAALIIADLCLDGDSEKAKDMIDDYDFAADISFSRKK